MTDLVQKYYTEYKEFIKENRLLDITINFDMSNDNLKDSAAYVIYDEVQNGSIPIHINKTLFSYNERYYKSILWHEFTHIYDMCITFADIKDNIMIHKLLSSYSEFHASQIELLCNLNCANNIDNITPFDMKDIICYKNTFEDVESSLIYPLSGAVSRLSRDKTYFLSDAQKKYSLEFHIAERSLCYYLGKYDVCMKFAKSRPHDFFKNFGEFEDDVRSLYFGLSNKNFNQVLYNGRLFMNHYFKYFIMS